MVPLVFSRAELDIEWEKKEAPQVLDECIALWVFQSSIFQELGYECCIMLSQNHMRDHESDSNM